MDLVDTNVHGKLLNLRRALRGRLAGEGAAWLLLALVALVLASLGLDYVFHLPLGARVAIMVLCLAGVGYVAIRQLIRPLAVPMDSDNLALLVERRHRQLGDRLISAIQFSRLPNLPSALMSGAMIERMACEANDLAQRCNFREIVERRGMWRMLKLACCGLMLLGGFSSWQSNIMKLWFQRNLMFRDDVSWPQQTYLQVLGGPFKVARGDDLTITVQADTTLGHEAPPYVTIHAEYPSVGMTEERVNLENGGTYKKTFQAVSEKFSFYVTGGDDRRDKDHPHDVQVVDPPSLLKVQFKVVYDPYTRRPSEDFDGSRGALVVRVGSTVLINAEANKDIKSASLSLDMGEGVKDLGAMQIRRTARRQLSGKFEIGTLNKACTGMLQFKLVDTDDYTNRRGAQYLVQVQPDSPPAVEFKTRGIGPRITSKAHIPMFFTVKDDGGVTGVTVLTLLPDLKGKPQPKPRTVATPRAVARQYEGQYVLDIKDLGLEAGLTLDLVAEATDNFPAGYGGPNKGSSSATRFTIVKPEDLKEEFLGRKRAIRIEFMQAITLQSTAQGKIASAIAALADPASRQARDDSASSAHTETLVGADCGKAATAWEDVVEEMENNQLNATGEVADQHGKIIDPLRGLRGVIDRLVVEINAAASISDPVKLREAMGSIQNAQEDLLGRMNKIKDEMLKDETRQDIAIEMELLINLSKSLHIQMVDWVEKGIKEGPETQPDKP